MKVKATNSGCTGPVGEMVEFFGGPAGVATCCLHRPSCLPTVPGKGVL